MSDFAPFLTAMVVAAVVVIGIPLLMMKALKQFIADAVERGIEQSWLGREARGRAAAKHAAARASKDTTAQAVRLPQGEE